MGQPTEEQKRWLDIIKNESHKIGHLAGFKKLTPLHHEWIKKMLMNKGTYVLKAHRGGYKCLNPNTKVMMADYSSKEIKDIQIGEYVMGWDGTHRKVLDVHCGRSPMYRVTLNKNGEYYECNNNHILTMRQRRIKHNKFHCVDEYRYAGDESIINIPIEDFLKSPASRTNGKNSRETFFKHFKVGLDNIPEQKVEIPPYILGLWLGDGSTNKIALTMDDKDSVCIEEFKNYCIKNGGVEHIYRKPNKTCATYAYYKGNLLNIFRTYGLLGNKHIPNEYLYNSRENRLELLAGLLDTDGHYSHHYSYSTVNKDLAYQVEWLARSLGYNAKVFEYKTTWTYNGIRKEKLAYNVYINGAIDEIPVRLERKKAKTKPNNKCHLSFSQTIEPIGEGAFVGIVIEGDGMFLLDNFLVVHNTTCIEEFIALKMILCPDQTMIFVRKTDDDVKEVVEKVKSLLQTPVFKEMVRVFYNTQLEFKKATAFEIDTNLHKELGGGSQLLAIGLKGSITGKHADGIIVDDICFVDGTQIATPFGDRNIEDLKVGDLVLTSNGYEKIVRTTNRKADVICNVGLCGTPNHPVFSSEINDYKPLKDITESELVRYNSKTYNTPQLKGIQTVYNIEVENTHNYYANGILVHNCNTKDRESRAERELTKRIWFELNSNIKNPSGWVVSTGTTWHPDDVFSVMPPAEIYTCYDTGLLTEEQIQEIKDNMPPALFAANYELRFVASDDCMFTTPNMVDEKDYYDEENKVTYLDMISHGLCHVDAGYGGGDYTAFTIMKKIPDKEDYLVIGKCWRRHVNDCIAEIESLIKKYKCGTLYLENNGDKGYLAREFKYRGIRVASYHERLNKHTKICTYAYRIWKKLKWLKQTDENYIGQVLDYTEMAEHDDCIDSLASLSFRFLASGKVVAVKGINI